MVEAKTFDAEEVLGYITDKTSEVGEFSASKPCKLRDSERCPFIKMEKDRHCGNCVFALEDQQTLAEALVGLGYLELVEPTHMRYMQGLELFSKFSKSFKKISVSHYDKSITVDIV